MFWRKKNTEYVGFKADALTGFIAGFLVGTIGMYVYVVVLGAVS